MTDAPDPADVDEGNINGDVIDDPSPNAAAVGVDIVSGAGNDVAPAADAPESDATGAFDPAEHTVTEVVDYLADNPDDADRVLELERAGRNRVGIVGES